MRTHDRLFVYGTLLAPELRQALIGRPLQGQAATLADFACFKVKRAVYPAIRPSAGAITRGEVLESVTEDDWLKFDEFETRLYQRRSVSLTLDEGGQTCAYTYVIDPSAVYRLSDLTWDYALFRRDHLHRYIGALTA